jgi:malate/lactate dehydrogenase
MTKKTVIIGTNKIAQELINLLMEEYSSKHIVVFGRDKGAHLSTTQRFLNAELVVDEFNRRKKYHAKYQHFSTGKESLTIEVGRSPQDMAGAHVIAITAGESWPVVEFEDRMAELPFSASIIQQYAQSIKQFAPHAFVATVTNPLDIFTWYLKEEIEFPTNQIVGIGPSLDSRRYQDSIKNVFKNAGITIEDCTALTVGPHSSRDMVLLRNSIRFDGKLLTEQSADSPIAKLSPTELDALLTQAEQATRQRGFKVAALLTEEEEKTYIALKMEMTFPAHLSRAQALVAYLKRDYDILRKKDDDPNYFMGFPLKVVMACKAFIRKLPLPEELDLYQLLGLDAPGFTPLSPPSYSTEEMLAKLAIGKPKVSAAGPAFMLSKAIMHFLGTDKSSPKQPVSMYLPKNNKLHYGVEDVCVGVLATIDEKGATPVDVEMSITEKQSFIAAAEEIKKQKQQLGTTTALAKTGDNIKQQFHQQQDQSQQNRKAIFLEQMQHHKKLVSEGLYQKICKQEVSNPQKCQSSSRPTLSPHKRSFHTLRGSQGISFFATTGTNADNKLNGSPVPVSTLAFFHRHLTPKISNKIAALASIKLKLF